MTGRKFLAAVMALALASAVSPLRAADVLIDIKGAGGTAQYIQRGKDTQLTVEVFVGDTVKWENLGTVTHTATSDLKVAGRFLFDTGNITTTGADKIKSVAFTQAMYDDAVRALGATAGGPVHIGYFCDKHPNAMGGKIIFKPANLRGARSRDDH
jgi:plastocyanin